MRQRKQMILVGAFMLLAATTLAQTNPTGTLSGKVVDQQWLPLPGVTVTVQSPALQGTRAVTTSANGDYIIPFLPPGDYVASFELSGFAAMKRNVRITLGQPIPLNVDLNVASLSETVTVVGEAVADFGQTATAVTSIKQELVEKLPLNRTFQSAALLTPGVQASGPSGSFAISGAASFENLYMINGVVVQDNIRNTPLNLFIEDALQETTTSTAAISAEFGRFSGGVVNAITKSGGNAFAGSFRTTFNNDDWTAITPYPNDSRTNEVIPTYEITLGGPILKDRLWFFGAARLRDLQETFTTFTTNINYTRGRDEKRYEGKLTWSLTANHTFKAAYSQIAFAETGNTFPPIMDEASLVNRSLPQQLLSVNYTGVLNPKFFVEAQYSLRKFTFQTSGSIYTDLIRGTLLLDQSRNNARYNSPTFCGVCDDEKRDNQNVIVKASYFLSTGKAGSHNLVFGADVFDDQRFANNHQSGSDYRIFTTSAIVQGTAIYPVLDNRSIIRWTPIFESSEGNNFRTYSLFANDAWSLDKHWSFNVGVRFDRNNGKDSLGTTVVNDSAFSPRLAVTYDPKGNGEWTVNGGYGRYVGAIANSVGDSASAGGQAATIDFDYLGPAVNVGNPANPVSAEAALNTLFNWFNANGGTNRPTRGAPTIPGVTDQIADSLVSPSVQEVILGFTRKLGSRGLVRLDGVFRKYTDFYSRRIDLTTGRTADQFGRVFDLALTENTDAVSREYQGLNFQISYRVGSRVGLGANYTLAKASGTFNGETGPNGPIRAGVEQFPEYFDVAWGSGTASGGGGPEGDLLVDVRNRARGWVTWDVPLPARYGTVSLGGLEIFSTGTPYGAVGLIDTRPYVTNPGYVTPPASVEYFFTERDALRTATIYRTDLSLNYAHKLGLGRTEVFFRGIVFNVFNRQELTNFTDIDCGTGGCIDTTILTNRNDASIARFNPFTETPVEGVNWRKGTSFGQPTSRYAYQTPRTWSFAVGLRF